MAEALIEQAYASDDGPAVDLGPEIDYSRYRDADLARLVSEVPVLSGRMHVPGTTVLLSYVRAEPMSIVIDETGELELAEALAPVREARGDAVLLLSVIDPEEQAAFVSAAERLMALRASARHEGLHAFALLTDGFGSGSRWIRAQHIEDLPWDQHSLRRHTKNWIGAPRTQAAIRAGMIAVPHSARRLDRWAPAATAHRGHPVDPSDAEGYGQFLRALAAVSSQGLTDAGMDDRDRAIFAATVSEQLGEFVGACRHDLDRCVDDLSLLAAHSRGRTRSRLLSAAAAVLLVSREQDEARTVLSAIDDIATSGGRTPLSEAVRMRLDGEIDQDQFSHALALSDIVVR